MSNPIIIQAERGPSLYDEAADKFITIYSLMDYIVPKLDLDSLKEVVGLTDEQLQVVLDYYHAHQNQLDAEYQEILADAKAREEEWDKKHSERNARMHAEFLDRVKRIRPEMERLQAQYPTEESRADPAYKAARDKLRSQLANK